MKLRRCALLAALAITLTAATHASAQTSGLTVQAPLPQAQQAAGYPVTGRVICADTQRAARFAQVTLLPATNGPDGDRPRGGRLSSRTDLDGNFVIPSVPAGDFYLTASATGYVDMTAQVQQAQQASTAAGADPGPALNGVPLIHVGAGGASTALILQRGGVIAGTVHWDDGTPAAGVSVSTQPVPPNNATSTSVSQLPGPGGRGFGNLFSFRGTETDDLGRFRISGLAPGTYYVRANVTAPIVQTANASNFARFQNLTVYAPDKPRHTDAAQITLGPGEERDDLTVTLGLSALHNVAGTVSSSGATVRSGNVSLADQTDSSLRRNGTINPDGSFVIPYVPAGTYTLSVNASSQLPSSGRGGGTLDASAPRFQPVQESITVADSDLSGVSVTVTAATSSP